MSIQLSKADLVVKGDFCAGDDIAELTAAQDPEIAKDLFLNCMYALVDTICRTEKPLIAAVNGLAYG